MPASVRTKNAPNALVVCESEQYKVAIAKQLSRKGKRSVRVRFEHSILAAHRMLKEDSMHGFPKCIIIDLDAARNRSSRFIEFIISRMQSYAPVILLGRRPYMESLAPYRERGVALILDKYYLPTLSVIEQHMR